MRNEVQIAADKLVIRRLFAKLGNGIRVEEFIAATGLTETRILAVLRYVPVPPRSADFYLGRPGQGWFYQPFIDRDGSVLA